MHLNNDRPKKHRAEEAVNLEPGQGSLEPWKGQRCLAPQPPTTET
jgi:hypothetical protein